MYHSMEEMTRAGCTSRRGIRHWEDVGLLGKVKRSSGDTRQYTDEQIRRARIIAAGQFGAFDLETIGKMLAEYDSDKQAYSAIILRLEEQTKAAIRLAENLPLPRLGAQEYDL